LANREWHHCLVGVGAALLEKRYHFAGVHFDTLLLASWKPISPDYHPIKVQNSQLLWHQVCLQAAMFPVSMIMDRTSETVSKPN